MSVIYKYELDNLGSPLEIPYGAKILNADFQDDQLFIWALVEKNNIKESRCFKAYGAGHEIPYMPDSKLIYISTAFMDNGLVFHIFEVKDSL